MKKYVVSMIAALIIVATVAPASVWAAEVKVGVMDLNTIISESDAGKAANTALAAMVQEKQAMVDAKGAEIEKLQNELKDKADSLTAEEKQAKQKEIDQLTKEYQQAATKAESDIQAKAKQMRDQILADVSKVVRIIGQNGNYTLIVDVSSVHYYNKVIDVTWEIIRTYNELRDQQQKSAGN